MLAKSKLNSIEDLISSALIDSVIYLVNNLVLFSYSWDEIDPRIKYLISEKCGVTGNINYNFCKIQNWFIKFFTNSKNIDFS